MSLSLRNLILVTGALAGLALSSCASLGIQNKSCIEQPGRSYENQNLVMVSSAKSNTESSAKFNAESQALEDIANECSFVTKGTRVDDQLAKREGNEVTVFVKIIVERSLCEEAKKSIKPQEIQKLSNLGYAEQILKNQIENEKKITFKSPPPNAKQKVELILAAEHPSMIHDDGDFFMARQQIAFLKQATLLSTQGLFSQKLIESDKMRFVLAQKIQAAQDYETLNPALKSSAMTWSTIKERISQSLKEDEQNSQNIVLQKPSKRGSKRKPAQKESSN